MSKQNDLGNPAAAYVIAVLAGAAGVTISLPLTVAPFVFPFALLVVGIVGGTIGLPLYAFMLKSNMANGFTAARCGATTAMIVPVLMAGSMIDPSDSAYFMLALFALAGASVGLIFWLELRWRSASTTERWKIALPAIFLGIAALAMTKL